MIKSNYKVQYWIKKEINSLIKQFVWKTITLFGSEFWFGKKWWKSYCNFIFLRRDSYLISKFLHSMLLFLEISSKNSKEGKKFFEKFFYWYLTSDLLKEWENNYGHSLPFDESSLNDRGQFSFILESKNWVKRIPKMDFDHLQEDFQQKINSVAIFFGNILKIFFKEVLAYQQSSVLEKAYDLGFYLAISICLSQIIKLKSKIFSSSKNAQPFFSDLKKYARSHFFLSKIFVNLQSIQILKFFFPKKYNFFISCFNTFNN